jgi:hypothetical protein
MVPAQQRLAAEHGVCTEVDDGLEVEPQLAAGRCLAQLGGPLERADCRDEQALVEHLDAIPTALFREEECGVGGGECVKRRRARGRMHDSATCRDDVFA